MNEPTQEQIIARQAAEQPPISANPAFIQEVIKEPVDNTPPSSADDEALTQMMQSEGWKVIKRYINAKKKRLEDLTAQSVRAQAFNLQEVGFRYLILDQVTNALQDVINRVETPAKMKLIAQSNEAGDETD